MPYQVFEVVQESDGGYCAECLTESIFTEGNPWDELRKNVLWATYAFFFDRPRPDRVRLHLVRDGSHAILETAQPTHHRIAIPDHIPSGSERCPAGRDHRVPLGDPRSPAEMSFVIRRALPRTPSGAEVRVADDPSGMARPPGRQVLVLPKGLNQSKYVRILVHHYDRNVSGRATSATELTLVSGKQF